MIMNYLIDIAARLFAGINNTGNVLRYTVTMPVSTAKATASVRYYVARNALRGYIPRVNDRCRHTLDDKDLVTVTLTNLSRRNHVKHSGKNTRRNREG
jgi:hypothetical protein